MEASQYIIFLLLTLIVETLVALAFKYRRHFLLAIICINLTSHPLATLGSEWIKNYLGNWQSIAIIEIAVIIFEFLVSRIFIKNQNKRLLVFWILANAISFGIGFIIIKLFF